MRSIECAYSKLVTLSGLAKCSMTRSICDSGASYSTYHCSYIGTDCHCSLYEIARILSFCTSFNYHDT